MDLHPTPESVIVRLVEATNAHDLESLVGCFASDYRNETPVHPARGFFGRALPHHGGTDEVHV